MIADLTQWVKSIVFVVLFASFLELLLPSSSMQKFVRAVLGLFIMMAILNPVAELLNNKPPGEKIEIAAGNFKSPEYFLEAKAVDSAGLRQKQEQLAKEHYIKELSKQIRATALSIEGVREAKVTISLKDTKVIPAALNGRGEAKESARAFTPQIEQVSILVSAQNAEPRSEEAKREVKRETKIEKIIIASPAATEPEAEAAFLKPPVKEKIKRTVSELYHIRPEKIQIKEQV